MRGLMIVVVVAGLSCGGFAADDRSDANKWTRVSEGHAGHRQGATLVWDRDLGKMLMVGDGVYAFDPASGSWSQISPEKTGGNNGIHPYYQTAYDPVTRSVYCLSNGSVLHVFNVTANAWETRAPEPLLDGLSWHMTAADGEGRVVVVGSDKRTGNVGWTRTLVLDTRSGQWSELPLPDEKTVLRHREHVAASEAVIDLVGGIRIAWYRDPKGVGTDAELQNLLQRLGDLGKLQVMSPFAADLGRIGERLRGKSTLDGLREARSMQRRVDDAMFEQYPVPRSRRNAPLAYDAKNRVFVLFGGDHEDYQMNDTWVLDLTGKSWKKMKPDLAPSPRAGHALVYLPKCGKLAAYEGYVPSGSRDYGARPWDTVNPVQLWLYDVKSDRWDLAGEWQVKGSGTQSPPVVGSFYGYSASWFEVPAVAADEEDRLVLAAPGTKDRKTSTWELKVDPASVDGGKRAELGRPPDERWLRPEYFRADFCEVPDDSKPVDLSKLAPNRWVALNPGPRVPMHGCRRRDWSTAVWDSGLGQVVMWGGGHCVRSSSVPIHYSPDSNRIVEGYDADEPYCFNGWCGPGSSVMNREWINAHAYHLYDYDPVCKLLVTARGFRYDPARMDWVRAEPFAPPFRYSWGGVVLAASDHGVVAWARKTGGEEVGLWLFDGEKGWQPLDPKGKLFEPYCDSHGMTYDSKRDRMVMSSVGGGYARTGSGSFMTFDFKTGNVETVTPENPDLNKTGCAREVVYVRHADWLLTGDLVRVGDARDPNARVFTRVYDCAKNRMSLLETGNAPSGFSAGWMYDARRGLVYSFSFRGEAWALRIDPASATLLDAAPTADPAQ